MNTMIKEIQTVNEETVKLLQVRNRLALTVAAFDNQDLSKYDETGVYFWGIRRNNTKAELDTVQEQIDFNIAFMEMSLQKASELMA